MIRFRVIQLKNYKKALKVVACLLLASLVILLGRSLRNQKVIATFGAKKINGSKEANELNLQDDILKQMLCWTMPSMNMYPKKLEARPVQPGPIFQKTFKWFTNVDIFNPKTYLSFHMPVMSLARAQTTITPGVDLPNPPSDPMGDEGPVPPKSQEDDVEKKSPVEGTGKMGPGPLVLIFHTHTSESFTPSPAYDYKPRDKSYHTEDLNFSIAKVGEDMAQVLEELNIPTLHDKSIHDIPTYITSYSNSLKTVERLLKENPSIQIVIDLHRDAPVVDRIKSREITTVQIDNLLYSRIMFVVGTDKTFPHPHWKENHNFALLLNERLESQYPGISRGIDLRTERFNQHVSKKALLIEIGSHGNTMEESLATGKLLAEVLAKVLHELYAR